MELIDVKDDVHSVLGRELIYIHYGHNSSIVFKSTTSKIVSKTVSMEFLATIHFIKFWDSYLIQSFDLDASKS